MRKKSPPHEWRGSWEPPVRGEEGTPEEKTGKKVDSYVYYVAFNQLDQPKVTKTANFMIPSDWDLWLETRMVRDAHV